MSENTSGEGKKSTVKNWLGKRKNQKRELQKVGKKWKIGHKIRGKQRGEIETRKKRRKNETTRSSSKAKSGEK